jgi:peptidoglycan/xylan/chitin deacetylase (PgdA/CDA1 family)
VVALVVVVVALSRLATGFRPPLVLTYHALGEVAPEHDPDNLVHPPAKFRSEIGGLKKRGYEFVTAGEFARRLRAARPPAGVCAVTFDDGSIDNATLLPGLLRELGIPATVFACPGLLGEPHPWIAREAGVRLMNSDELRMVSDLGFVEVGSHTWDHADLEAAEEVEILRQMTSSKEALEEIVQRPVLTLAYPFCRYSPTCPSAAARAGYLGAFTCAGRGSWQPYELRRVMMDRHHSRVVWALKSRGLFDAVVGSPAARAVRATRRVAGA